MYNNSNEPPVLKDLKLLLSSKLEYAETTPNKRVELEIKIIGKAIEYITRNDEAKDQQLYEVHRAILRQKEAIQRLEAVLLIHGVTDLEAYASKGLKWLIDELQHLHNEGAVIVPTQLRKTLNTPTI